MFQCIGLNKRNLLDFKELNKTKNEFNFLNKDFFEAYYKTNFAQQILFRRRVKLLKMNENFIGYIWYDVDDKNICTINAMNVLNTFGNLENYIASFRFLIDNLNKNYTVTYLCESNSFNHQILSNIGFLKKEGTLILYSNLDNAAQFECADELQFEVLRRGRDEQKRCDLQNEIFKDDSRVPLTIDDIYFDETQGYYYEKGAILLKKDGQYIGYGQIIIEDRLPLIVNFGILKNYRGNGYSKIFLNYLIKILRFNGFNKVKIKVKNTNIVALNLYKSMGFKVHSEVFNWELKRKP